MRTLLEWIKSHKLITGFALVLAAAFLIYGRERVQEQRRGRLSEPVRRGGIVESVYGIGTVTASNTFQLRSGVLSSINRIYVREGDKVKKGDRLVLLETTAVFTAPFDGTVTWLPMRPGETVFPQSIILSLVDLLDRYMVVSVEQRGILRVRTGFTARISFDSMRDETFEGRVSSVYSHENQFLVGIDVKDLPPYILPGMTGDVAIEVAARDGVLLIPVAALDDGEVLVGKDGGKPERVPVKTGAVDGAYAEVLEGGVREGDRLVLREKARR